MSPDHKKALKKYLPEIAKHMADIKETQVTVREIVAIVADKTEMSTKAIRKAAKDLNLSDLERQDQRLVEDQLDECRSALGILADTPLGDAAERTVTQKREEKAFEGAGASA